MPNPQEHSNVTISNNSSSQIMDKGTSNISSKLPLISWVNSRAHKEYSGLHMDDICCWTVLDLCVFGCMFDWNPKKSWLSFILSHSRVGSICCPCTRDAHSN